MKTIKALIIRPSPDGENLVKILLSIGQFGYHLPLIKLYPSKNLSLLPQKLKILSPGDLLFITSKNAINYAHDLLLRMNIAWPKKLKYFSIGKNTSAKMYKLSGILAKYPKKIETSENLLKLPELNYIWGRKALILRGNQGRFFLEKNLKIKGVKVYCSECYIRKQLHYNGEEQSIKFLSLGINTIIATSGNILIQLYNLIPKNYQKSWLIHCQLIVVSNRLAKIAKKLGWNKNNISISNSANNNALLKIITQFLPKKNH